MAALDVALGEALVGFSNFVDSDPTLGTISEATPPEELVSYLLQQLSDLKVLVEGKADKAQIKSEIAFSDEGVKIAGDEIVLFGNVTLAQVVNDQRGAGDGSLDISLTRIIGNRIQTGVITSNNWGSSQGTAIDLDNETFTLGGSASPDLYYDGAGNLTLTGTLQAGSIISTTATVNGTNMGAIETHATTTGSNPHNTPLSTITGDLDDIADGSTYFKSTANQNTGADRAYNALDSSFDYIRSISTQTIAVSGSNPTNGLVIDSAGMRGYDGGSLTLEINASTGTSTWSGDIVTSGQVEASGTTSSGGVNAAIVANGMPASVIGIAAIKDALGTADPIQGIAASAVNAVSGSNSGASGTGVYGWSLNSSGYGVEAYNSAGGAALRLASSSIAGDANFLDDVDIDLTLIVGGATTLSSTLSVSSTATLNGTANFNSTSTFNAGVTINADVDIQGNSSLDVDRSVFFASDGASGDSSVVIGSGSGATGQNTLVFQEGAAGSVVANQMHLYGAYDSGQAKTTLGLVCEANVESGTGAFAGINQLPVLVKGVRYKLPLEAY